MHSNHLENEKDVVALVGSPNSGKTTLFNWLTGLKYNTVNYPGSTVDFSVGFTHSRYGSPIRLMDTPGVYSLDPKSPDEEVTLKALFDHPQFGRASLVIAVIDATHLSRHLFLVQQLISKGFSVVVALTMMDLVSEKGDEIDTLLLSQELRCPVMGIDGRLGGGVMDLVAEVRSRLLQKKSGSVSSSSSSSSPLVFSKKHEIEQIMNQMQKLSQKVVKRTLFHSRADAKVRTAQIDSLLLHPIWGLVFFFLIMAGIFISIYWLAQPLMEVVDGAFSGLAQWVHQVAPGRLWTDFVADGLISSFGAVLVFVPQIFILFLGIAVLEDSGYLARSATLIDRPMRWLGLSGRSFVPLLSGYACAVPALMATRTISGRRERWLTMFIIPLMSCSARLPVYSLLLTFVFFKDSAWKAGVALAVIYFGSMVVGALAALLANRLIKIKERSFFCLELPVYRRPLFSSLLRQAYSRTKNYVRRAGPVIFVISILIWVGTNFPHYRIENESEKLQKSFLGQIGKSIEPVFLPMGVDWRVGVGLLSAFAAREVFVSSLAIVFNAANDSKNQDSMQESLLNQMMNARMPDGSLVFTPSSIFGLIVFFMIALQCFSTTSVAMRESGGWKFAIMQLILFNIVAYGVTVSIVQGLRALGVS